jgi:hypothetical protein
MSLTLRQTLAIPGEPTVGFGSGSSFAGRAGIAVAGARTGRATVSTCGVTAISGGLSGMNRLTDTMNATTEPPSTRAARRLSRRLTRASRLPPPPQGPGEEQTRIVYSDHPRRGHLPLLSIRWCLAATQILTVTGRRASGQLLFGIRGCGAARCRAHRADWPNA